MESRLYSMILRRVKCSMSPTNPASWVNACSRTVFSIFSESLPWWWNSCCLSVLWKEMDYQPSMNLTLKSRITGMPFMEWNAIYDAHCFSCVSTCCVRVCLAWLWDINIVVNLIMNTILRIFAHNQPIPFHLLSHYMDYIATATCISQAWTWVL